MSSSSTVCQGLQSCLEPLATHPSPLMHPLIPSKQDLSFPWTTPNESKNPYPENQGNCYPNGDKNNDCSSGAWNFVLALTNNSYNSSRKFTSDDLSEQAYVHPLARRSVSSLSARSLEMCTESLGSETGTHIDTITDEFSYPRSMRESVTNQRPLELSKRNKHVSVIPPPLTSIRGRYCVHLLQIQREDGRLVIKASRFSSCRTCFKSERGNGRLRLSLMKDDRRNVNQAAASAEFHRMSEQNDADSNGGKIGGKLGLGERSSSNRCIGDDHQTANKRLPRAFPIYVAMS